MEEDKITKKEDVQKLEAEIKQKMQKNHNKIIRNFIIVFVMFLVVVGAWLFSSYQQSHFDYRGLTGNVVQEGQLTLYQTSIPVMYQGAKTDYYFYLRNNPEKLADVAFDGSLDIRRDMVINSKEEFMCEGKGVIAIANLVKLYQLLGTNIIQNDSIDCSPDGSYMVLKIESTDGETSIDRITEACYSIKVKDCEILEATERFMVETFVEIKDYA